MKSYRGIQRCFLPVLAENANPFENPPLRMNNPFWIIRADQLIPKRMAFFGQDTVIFAELKRKLATARKRRSLARSQVEPETPRPSGQTEIRVPELCPL